MILSLNRNFFKLNRRYITYEELTPFLLACCLVRFLFCRYITYEELTPASSMSVPSEYSGVERRYITYEELTLCYYFLNYFSWDTISCRYITYEELKENLEGDDMFVILTYDIKNVRVGKVLKVCRKYLTHHQKSVFEGMITEAKLERLKKELERIILKDEDSICIYKISSLKYTSREELGVVEVKDNIL